VKKGKKGTRDFQGEGGRGIFREVSKKDPTKKKKKKDTTARY